MWANIWTRIICSKHILKILKLDLTSMSRVIMIMDLWLRFMCHSKERWTAKILLNLTDIGRQYASKGLLLWGKCT